MDLMLKELLYAGLFILLALLAAGFVKLCDKYQKEK